MTELLEQKDHTETIARIQSAVVDMMAKVKYEPKKHVYTLSSTGEWLQGVSTVSSIVPKDWLAAWGAKESVKALGYSDYGDLTVANEMLAKIKAMTVEEYVILLKEVKGASRKKSKEAMADGTKGHSMLELYVKFKQGKNPEPVVTDPLILRAYNQFVEWSEKNVKQWVLSEARVCYPEKKYAGTLDGLAIMSNDRLALIDFKFASRISEDYYLQTAGYAACFEPYGIYVRDRIIIRLPKTLEREEYDKAKFKYKKVPNNLEVEIVGTNYEMDRDTFFACLPVKKWINLVTK